MSNTPQPEKSVISFGVFMDAQRSLLVPGHELEWIEHHSAEFREWVEAHYHVVSDPGHGNPRTVLATVPERFRSGVG